MPIYRYTARIEGGSAGGETEAASREEALRKLEAMGLGTDIELTEREPAAGAAGSAPGAAGGAAGTPPPPRPPAPPGAAGGAPAGDSPADRTDLDRVLEELKQLVDLTRVSLSISAGIHAAVAGTLPPAAARGAPAAAGGTLPPPGPGDEAERRDLEGRGFVSPTARLAYEEEGGRLGYFGARAGRIRLAGKRLATTVGEVTGRARKLFRGGLTRGAAAGRRVGGALFGAAGRTVGGIAGGAAGGLLGAAGGAAAGVGALAVGFVEATKAVTAWTDRALDSARRLADVSGSMAAVMAEREARDLVRDVRRGEATAGSAQGLVEAESRRKDALAPLTNSLDNATNSLLASLNNVISRIIEFLNPFFEKLWNALRELIKTLTLGEVDIGKWGGDDKGFTARTTMLGEAAAIQAAVDRMSAVGGDLMAAAAAAGMGRLGVAAPAGAGPLGGFGGL